MFLILLHTGLIGKKICVLFFSSWWYVCGNHIYSFAWYIWFINYDFHSLLNLRRRHLTLKKKHFESYLVTETMSVI